MNNRQFYHRMKKYSGRSRITTVVAQLLAPGKTGNKKSFKCSKLCSIRM